MRSIIVLTLVCGVLTACGGGGGNSSSQQAQAGEKSLFSKWHTSDDSLTLDFTNGAIGTIPFNVDFKNGARCSCTLHSSGQENSGTYEISSCSYVNFTGPGSDPGCSSLESDGYYIKTISMLNICDSDGCNMYY